MNPDVLGYDVIPKTPATEGKAVLAFARRDPFELLYVMLAGPVMRILGKDHCRASFDVAEIAMAFV